MPSQPRARAKLARVRASRSMPRAIPTRFNRKYEVRWSDLDPNGHLRHSEYSAYATATRIAIMSDFDYPVPRFQREGFGAVIFREEIIFKREIHLGEELLIDFRLGARSTCGRKWTVHHHFFKENGKLAAMCTFDGGWFDVERRRLMRPPEELNVVLQRIENEWDAEVDRLS